MRCLHNLSSSSSRLLSNLIMSMLGFLPNLKRRQAIQIFVKLRSMEELSVIALLFEVYKKLVILSTTIDKKYRHTLTEPTVTSCRKTLEQLIAAKHAPKSLKNSHLIIADVEAELTALQLRAILELKLSNETNLLKLQAKLSECRRQIGGWRKSTL